MCEDRCPLLAFLRDELRRLVPLERTTEAGPLLVTVKQAAETLALGQTEIWGLIGRGDLPSVKVGRLRRIPAQALRDFVAALEEEAGHGS